MIAPRNAKAAIARLRGLQLQGIESLIIQGADDPLLPEFEAFFDTPRAGLGETAAKGNSVRHQALRDGGAKALRVDDGPASLHESVRQPLHEQRLADGRRERAAVEIES